MAHDGAAAAPGHALLFDRSRDRAEQYVDVTAEAASPEAGRVFVHLEEHEDALYFGHETRFDRLALDSREKRPAERSRLHWEYWDGEDWRDLAVRDDLDAAADDGDADWRRTFSWEAPDGWSVRTVGDEEVQIEGQYWVRVRLAAALIVVPWWRRLAAAPALPLAAALVVATVGTAAVVDGLTGTSASGGGPGSSYTPPALERPTGDLPDSAALVLGTWSLTTTEAAADGVCAGEVGDVYTYDIVIEQHDNQLRVRGVGGVPDEVWDAVLLETAGVGGDPSRVTAALIRFSGSFPDGEGTTTAQFDLTIDFENLTCGGTKRWSWRGSEGVCPNGLSTIEGYKVE